MGCRTFPRRRGVPASAPLGGRRREHGATGLEYTGIIAIAALVVGAIWLAVSTTNIEEKVAAGMCHVLGQDNCGAVSAPTFAPSPLEQALAGNYVALGDSFASGEGAGDYDLPTDIDRSKDWRWGVDTGGYRNMCHRSSNSYASRIYGKHDLDFAGSFRAAYCSGAVSRHLYNPADGRDGKDPQHGEMRQLAHLNEDTSLVTMSIGGNDIGFGAVLTDCALNVEPFMKCQDKWDSELDRRMRVFEYEVTLLYRKMKDRAPNARIIIMGYPRLFHEPPSERISNLLFFEDQLWMNRKADQLNATLRRAAQRTGVEFIDPTQAFIGHGVGAPNGEQWINDLIFSGSGSITDPGSFHPNALGHAAMAELLEEQLRNPQFP